MNPATIVGQHFINCFQQPVAILSFAAARSFVVYIYEKQYRHFAGALYVSLSLIYIHDTAAPQKGEKHLTGLFVHAFPGVPLG